jgi:hypothetical protein
MKRPPEAASKRFNATDSTSSQARHDIFRLDGHGHHRETDRQCNSYGPKGNPHGPPPMGRLTISNALIGIWFH